MIAYIVRVTIGIGYRLWYLGIWVSLILGVQVYKSHNLKPGVTIGYNLVLDNLRDSHSKFYVYLYGIYIGSEAKGSLYLILMVTGYMLYHTLNTHTKPWSLKVKVISIKL